MVTNSQHMVIDNLTSQTMVLDLTTNYSMPLNLSSLDEMDNLSLIQIKEVLNIFEEDNMVLQEPVNTIVITVYCLLVSTAGNVYHTNNLKPIYTGL